MTAAAAAARWDVVVVGAGPAGSIAALVLARAGARVALVDKAGFPRDKACGDLIGPRGVRLLDELGLTAPRAGTEADVLVAGPSGRRSRLPAFSGRAYADHALVVPRRTFDDSLRAAAIAAGAVPVRARVGAADLAADGSAAALVTGDGERLRGDFVIGADGALSKVACLAGMLDPDDALWGFAIRGYLPALVPLPLLVLLDARPWHIYPGYGWLFPGEAGQANIGIGVGMGRRRAAAPLRADLDRLCAQLRRSSDLAPDASPGRIVGGWLRFGGTGAPPAARNVLLAGDAAGLINPLQGEGIAPAMASGRAAAQAIIADPARAGAVYTEALGELMGPYMTGAAALQEAMLARPRLASASMRLLTAPPLRRLVAGTWSLYWNGLADGAVPRPSARAAAAIESLTFRAAARRKRAMGGGAVRVAARPGPAGPGPAGSGPAGSGAAGRSD
ncbi:MAG TPA: geranylgeranyl reductase family protein [Streptosporangiaceae bacterium]